MDFEKVFKKTVKLSAEPLIAIIKELAIDHGISFNEALDVVKLDTLMKTTALSSLKGLPRGIANDILKSECNCAKCRKKRQEEQGINLMGKAPKGEA